MQNELRDHLEKLIAENEVILFMKGNPEAPACGFSARSSAVLNSLGKSYAAVDILPDPSIRTTLTELSEWPTIPQLFVKGELVGGCDIMMELYESGELAQMLGVEQPPAEAAAGIDQAHTAVTEAKHGIKLENKLN